MSTTTTARRIALLGTSSLGLAAIVSAVSLGAAFTPTAAAAQATCVSGTAVNNNGTNNVTIAGGTNNPGITCAYVGDNALVSTLAATTVSTTAPGGGINLTAAGTDDINWNSTAGTVTGGAQTNGPVIDAQTSGAGIINLTTANVTANTSVGTHGIYAQSTGAGDIIMSVGTVTNASSVVGRRGIEAITNGGDITITANSVSTSSSNSAAVNSARSDGIVATTSGAGAIALNLNGLVSGHGVGGAAIRVTNGTGDVVINANGEIRGGNSGAAAHRQLAAGLVINSGGDISINTTSLIMGAIHGDGPRAPAIVASGDTFTLTLTGNPNSVPDAVNTYRASLGGYYTGDGIGLSATGQISRSIPGIGNNSRFTGGHVDLSGVTGGATLNFNSRSRWSLTDTSLMSMGDDVVNFDATSVFVTATTNTNVPEAILVGDVDQTVIAPAIIDFGAGHDTVNNAGRFLIGPGYSPSNGIGTAPDLPPNVQIRFGIRGEVRLLNLEQFNNSGEIWLGPMLYGASSDHVITRTDGWHDDLLYMPGATFHGEEGSIVFMDVDLNKTQTSCAPSTRDSQGYLPAADCIGLQGGAATGRTELRIVELISGDRGPFNAQGIVLVDLAGGDPSLTDPGAFVISPDTPRYADAGPNGAIDKGVFLYALGFDADQQQFRLYGIPSTGSQQFPILATAANQLWRTSTEGWFNRRVHQREVDYDGGLGTGAWFNISGVGTERDISTTIALGTSEAEFNNSYEQSDVTVSFGWDLLDYGSNAALGAMVGYARSEIEFDGSDNSANLEGIHAGVYGGYAVGGFFIDGAVNGTILTLDNDVPAMTLVPTGTMLGTDLRSLGAQVEAGWRWDTGALAIEPLVGFSAVNTDFDDFRIPNDDTDVNRPGVTVKLDSAESRRASAGLRFTMRNIWNQTAPTTVSVTARAVNEFEGGANVSVANVGPTYISTDELDGMFTQLTGSVGISNVARTISGYLNVDTIFGDDYDSLGASLGVRMHW